jgi:hypothetical protein
MVSIENREVNPRPTYIDGCKQVNHESHDDEGFLELPLKEATKTKYPPGCPVQVCLYHDENTQETPHGTVGPRVSEVVVGHVAQVGIAWYGGRGNRETMYKVIPCDSTPSANQGTKPFLVKEDRLQFAIGTHVWFWNVTSQENATVVASNHLPQVDQCVCYYSVQCNAGSRQVYHGVALSNLAFRFSEMPPLAWQELVVKREDDSIYGEGTIDPEDHPSFAESSTVESDSTSTDASLAYSSKSSGGIPGTEMGTAPEDSRDSTPFSLRSSSAEPFEPLVPYSATSATRLSAESYEPHMPDAATSATRLSGNAVTEVRNASEGTYAVSGDASGSKGPPHGIVPEAIINATQIVLSGKIGSPTLNASEVTQDIAKTPTTGQVEALVAQDDPTTQASPRHEQGTRQQVQRSRVCSEKQTIPTTPRRFVTNADSGRLQWIAFGERHDFKLALQSLRHTAYDRDWRSFLFARCLQWHLRGACCADCWRKDDHRPLSDSMVKKLEEGLRSVTSSAGPIFSKPNDGSKRQRLFY